MSCKILSSPHGYNVFVSKTGHHYVVFLAHRGNRELLLIGLGAFSPVITVQLLSDNDDQSLLGKILSYADMTLLEKN